MYFFVWKFEWAVSSFANIHNFSFLEKNTPCFDEKNSQLNSKVLFILFFWNSSEKCQFLFEIANFIFNPAQLRYDM